jgi:hypothetical protein
VSLKAIHILFILASIFLSVACGLWAVADGKMAWFAAISFGGAVALAVYLVSFVKKAKGLR